MHAHQPTDVAAIKAEVLAALKNGIKSPPRGDRLQLGKPLRDALAAARHLGIVTYEEVIAADIPEGGMALPRLDAQHWPTADVTCLFHDEGHPLLAWLHAARGANPACFYLFGRKATTGEWLMLPSTLVTRGRLPQPATRFSVAEVLDLAEFINVMACAMDALALALRRPLSAAA
jgi:hypothetical protein